MLLTLILLWLCGVTVAFLIKAYKNLLAQEPEQKPTDSADEEPLKNVIGEVRSVATVESLSAPIQTPIADVAVIPMQTVAPTAEEEKPSDDGIPRDDTKEHDISGEFNIMPKLSDSSQNERVSQHYKDSMPEETPEENPDGCNLANLDDHLVTMLSKNEEFEEVVSNPRKLMELLRTHEKLENSAYYNKLRENKEADTRAIRLSHIAKEVFMRNIQKHFDDTS